MLIYNYCCGETVGYDTIGDKKSTLKLLTAAVAATPAASARRVYSLEIPRLERPLTPPHPGPRSWVHTHTF